MPVEETTDLPLPTLPDLDHYIKELDVDIQADTLAQLRWKIPESIQLLVQDDYASYSTYCLQKESGYIVVQQQQSTVPVAVRPLGNYDSMHCTASKVNFSLLLLANTFSFHLNAFACYQLLFSVFFPLLNHTLCYPSFIFPSFILRPTSFPSPPLRLPHPNLYLYPSEPGVPYMCRVTFSHTLNSNRTERQNITFFTRQLGEYLSL